MSINYKPVITQKSKHFPFGSLSDQTLSKYRQIFVKKRLTYKNESQYETLQHKIAALKNAHHSNMINIKWIEQCERGCIDIYYNYVHHKLEDLAPDQSITLKSAHQQLIKMIVQAAKHFLIVPFDSKNCGVKIINGQKIIKYHFSFQQIQIETDIKAIERSVQLFTVQAMQFLDQLIFGKNDKVNSLIAAQKRRLTFTTQARKSGSELIPPIGLFSERQFRNSVNLQYVGIDNQKKEITGKKTDTSTLHTIPTRESLSKEGKRKGLKSRSLQKMIETREEFGVRLEKVKVRSRAAMAKMGEMKRNLLVGQDEGKCRKYTVDELIFFRRLSLMSR